MYIIVLMKFLEYSKKYTIRAVSDSRKISNA